MRLLIAFSCAAWAITAFQPLFSNQQQRRPAIGLAVSVVTSSPSLTSEDGDPGENHLNSPLLTTEVNSNDSDNSINHQRSSVGFSKVKWKKKRFLLLRDVTELIDQGQYDKAARKAKEAVRRMTALHEQTGHPEYLPNLQAYNLWIHAIAKSPRNPNAGQEAEAVLRELQQQQQQQQPNGTTTTTLLRPSAITYTSVMDAYASRGQAEHAERILMELLGEYERRPSQRDLQLTSVTFDTVLNAWASRKTTKGAERAEEILQRLEWLVESSSRNAKVRPTPHSYATVIHAWAMCGGGVDAAHRANHLLNTLIEGSRPVHVQPDTVIFNAAMHAWANSGSEIAGTKASAILEQMKQLYSSGTNRNCRPDIVSYNTVLSAWSHSPGHPQAGTQAERILQEMITSHRADPSSEVAPNTVSYNCVLHAWSHSSLEGADTRAERVLEYMLAGAAASKDKSDPATTIRLSIAPDVYSFTSVLNAVAKSKDPDKAVRAEKWLFRLLDLCQSAEGPELRPTQIPFNTVMNACAFSAQNTSEEQRMRAVEVAVSALATMREHRIDPDEVTYYNMVKCAANLLSHSRRSRQDMIVPLFEACCQAGLVTEPTWNQVCKAVGFRTLQENFGVSSHREDSYRSLPKRWKRNVSQSARATQDRDQRDSGMSRSPRAGPVQRPRILSESSYQSGRDL